MSDRRQQQLFSWIKTLPHCQQAILLPMAGDASFRRYFRVQTSTGSFVAMDAPPDKEDCKPYVTVATLLRKAGLSAPEIIATSLPDGFLLLSDYGDVTYLKALNTHNADTLYRAALTTITKLQRVSDVAPLPCFARDQMTLEWTLHREWFAGEWLNVSLGKTFDAVEQCYQKLIQEALSQPQVFMHRDYHSLNLMVIQAGVGLLDFQDAALGPITYDAVSLLRDCYIDWPEAQVHDWLRFFMQASKAQGTLPHEIDEETFVRWFDWMGMQRHLKALMIFVRKWLRDHDARYLKHLPRVLTYLERVSARYDTLSPLHGYVTEIAIPKTKETLVTCVP